MGGRSKLGRSHRATERSIHLSSAAAQETPEGRSHRATQRSIHLPSAAAQETAEDAAHDLAANLAGGGSRRALKHAGGKGIVNAAAWTDGRFERASYRIENRRLRSGASCPSRRGNRRSRRGSGGRGLVRRARL